MISKELVRIETYFNPEHASIAAYSEQKYGLSRI